MGNQQGNISREKMIIFLLCLILSGVAWLISHSLGEWIISTIVITYIYVMWSESRIEFFPTLAGGIKSLEGIDTPKEFIKCKACKGYFHKDKLAQHIVDVAIEEQRLINEMTHFSRIFFARNKHKSYMTSAVEKIKRVGGNLSIKDGDRIK